MQLCSTCKYVREYKLKYKFPDWRFEKYENGVFTVPLTKGKICYLYCKKGVFMKEQHVISMAMIDCKHYKDNGLGKTTKQEGNFIKERTMYLEDLRELQKERKRNIINAVGQFIDALNEVEEHSLRMMIENIRELNKKENDKRTDFRDPLGNVCDDILKQEDSLKKAHRLAGFGE